VALNGLESAASLAQANQQNEITLTHLQEALQKKPLQYDKSGEEHYNVISAFIKSMRGSDPDAALYWMMRMLEAGEEPLFIARRMVIFASEDIGNADPHALQVAVAAKDAVHFVGLPEGKIPLAQAATYLASAPKSNASYKAMLAAAQDVEVHGALAVPMHLRNAPTGLMKNLGYGKDYQYAHNYKTISSPNNTCPTSLPAGVTTHRNPATRNKSKKDQYWEEKSRSDERHSNLAAWTQSKVKIYHEGHEVFENQLSDSCSSCPSCPVM
jgi:putative ATPase